MVKIKNIVDPTLLANQLYKAHIKSIKELSEKIGIDRSYISHCVSAEVGVSNKVLYAMAKVLDCEPKDLLREPRISHL